MNSALSARIKTLDELAPGIEERMFAIYSRYYSATSYNRFMADLDNKTHVLLLFDEHDNIRGFTTIARYFHTVTASRLKEEYSRVMQVVFSGDTIIEHGFWGQQVLPMAWIEQTGRFKAEHPDLPLYWLLIVKGYRTYRYLSVFSKHYYPSVNSQSSDELQSLLHVLAIERFGDAYNRDTGCIVFPESRGHLAGDWASIPERVKSRPEVSYFLARNPQFQLGHELACITQLCPGNLTRRARIAFERGFEHHRKRGQVQ